MLLSTMLSKKMFIYFMLGFLIVAYSGLDLVGVTLFAIILAYILDQGILWKRSKCIIMEQKKLTRFA